MSNGAFALLFGKILRSSIWLDDYPTRIMWITLLLLKDKDGLIPKSSIDGLAHVANVKPEEAREAMEKFMSPDPKSGNQNDDGRRIKDMGDSWQIINHELYQFSTEARRLAWAEHKRMQRERSREKALLKKLKRSRPQPGEVQAVNGTPVQDLDGELKDVRQAKGGFDPLA